MTSSGIKRGVATFAISALAVAGLPFLAGSAVATTVATDVDTDLGPNAAELYAPGDLSGISAKNDGTNTTVSLLAGAGTNVTNVLFQYSTNAGATWTDIGVADTTRTDGVFGVDWAAPVAGTNRVRAVPSTGVANADTHTVAIVPDGTANTVELASEGTRGVFQSPYTEAGRDGDYVGVTGTVSQGSAAPTITDASHESGASDTATLETTPDTASDTFNAVVDIDGYPYNMTPGGGNEIAFNAATSNTDDAEGSTLYIQTVGSITASPQTQEDASPGDSTTTLTVRDNTAQQAPVAGAQVFRGGDTDTDGAGGTADTDTDGPFELVGYTNGRGQVVADPAVGPEAGPGAAGTERYYVNVTDDDAFNAGDPFTDVTVTTFTQALTSVAIVNGRSRTDFDLDELADGDDFTIETRDQRGNPFDETGTVVPEYRFIIDPSGTGATFTGNFEPATATAKPGVYGVALPDPYQGFDLVEGSYTLEARRPNNANGTGGMNATNTVTVTASESEIRWGSGDNANAPIEGSTTQTGTLSSDNGPLAGRVVTITYTPGGDSQVATQQPAGTTRNSATSATAVTDASGNFSVTLADTDQPANVTPVPENGTLNAVATGEAQTDDNGPTTLQNAGYGLADDPNEQTPTNVPDNAEDTTRVNFAVQADAEFIDLDVEAIYPGDGAFRSVEYGPGRPAGLDIAVFGADANNNGQQDAAERLNDFPVTITVNKGFLSPDAENEDQVTLAAGQNDDGDLWGFFQNDGQSVNRDTGDNGVTGALAAIEREADFDDDGRTTQTVTVTAGDETQTVTLNLDNTAPINTTAVSLTRAPGEPAGDVVVGDEVDFDLTAQDQFGNQVGDQFARITDDSTVADFRTDEDLDQTLTDFTVSNPGITAFNTNAPTVQVLMAALNQEKTLVEDDGAAEDDPIQSFETVTDASDPINWVGATEEPGPVAIIAKLRGKNNGARADRLVVKAPARAAGATVNLFRFKGEGRKVLVRTGELNARGDKKFRVRDLNGRQITQYVAKVKRTDDTRAVTTNRRKVR